MNYKNKSKDEIIIELQELQQKYNSLKESSEKDILERKQAEERIVKLNECFLKFGADPLVNINLLVALCGELMDATCSLYNRLQGNMLCSLGQWNTPANFQSIDNPEGHLCKDVISSTNRNIFIIRDLQNTTYALTDPNVRLYKLSTYIGKAVKFDNQNVGSLCIVYQRDMIPGENDIHLMDIIASAIGVEENRRQALQELEESKERYQRITAGLTDYLYTVKVKDGKAVETIHNEACIAITGYSSEEFAADPYLWFNMIIPEERELVTGRISKILNGEFVLPFEHSIISKNGKIRWICNTIIPKYNSIGALVAYDGVIKDISERKLAEKEMAESEERFRSLFEGAPDAIILADTETGRILNVNKATCRLLAKTTEDIVGMYQHELHPPDPSDFAKETFKHHLKESQDQGFTHPIENYVQRSDGVHVPVEVLAQIIKIHDQNILMGIFRDITIRKQSEQELRESEEKFKEIFEANTDGITIFRINPFGPPSSIIDLNENAAKMLGYNKEEMLRMSPGSLEKGITKEQMDKRRNDIRSHGFSNFESILNHKDGHDINVEIKVKVINYNKQPALMNIARDITERKNNEVKLQKFAGELSKLNSDKDRFISILAHDLKSPFNTILGFLELITQNIRKYDIDKIEKHINLVSNSAKNTFNLLEDILMWARAQSGKIPYRPQKLNLENIFQDIIENMKYVSANKNITVNYFVAEEINVFADINMLKTILRNLVSNAIKFTNYGGQIDISVNQNKSNLTITVSDNGVGMDDDKLTKLFDISQTVMTEGTANESGTGLGLLLCKEFVEKQGGKIWVESKQGKGSDFKFTLPFVSDDLKK